MKNKPFFTKRILTILGGIALLLLAILLFFPFQENFLRTGPQDMKMIEIENMKIVGFKKGTRMFEVTARYVWSPRTVDRATFEDISDGSAYDKGRPVLKGLQARRVYANSSIEELVAQEGVKALLLRRQGKDPEPVSIWAENMFYSGHDKKTQVSGSLRLQQKEALVYADQASVDHRTDQATFPAPFRVLYRNSCMTAQAMKIFLNEERFTLNGNAKILRKKEKIPTGDELDEREVMFKKDDLEINADLIEFHYDHNRARAYLKGRIVVLQGKKKAFGDEGFYDETKDYIELRKAGATGKQAGMILDKAKVFVDAETLKKLRNPTVRESFSQSTTVLADILRIKIDAKDVMAKGTVKVTQKGKEAYADRAYYLAEDDLIKLYGSVRFQNDQGTWVSAEQAVVSLKDSTFHAVGDVDTNIILKK